MSVARRTCYLKLHQATRSIRHRAQIINTCHSHVGLRSLTTDGASRPPLDEAEKLVRKVSSVARVKKSEGLAKHSSRQKAAIDKSRQQFSVFTSNAHATTKESVLEEVGEWWSTVQHYDEPTVVVLVTPTFASWLSDDAFVGKLLAALFRRPDTTPTWQHSPPVLEASSLLAVVDGLPTFTPRESSVASGEESPSEASTEGFSFLLGNRSEVAPGLGRTTAVKNEDMQVDHPAILNIVAWTRVRDEPWPLQQTISVLLANTMFKNGRASTMVLKKWTRKLETAEFWLTGEPRYLARQRVMPRPSSTTLRPEFHGTGSEPSTSVRVRLRPNTEPCTRMSLPLIRLTPGRYIVNSLGNIIRTIAAGDGEEVPASRELERSLDAYLEAQDVPKQSVTVWALVSKATNRHARKLASQNAFGGIAENWKPSSSHRPRDRFTLGAAFAGGSRLHRVLSGGGGWGPKAGLLSLDPRNSVDTPVVQNPITMDDGPNDASTFEGPGSKGHLIQFFVAHHSAIRLPRISTEALKKGSTVIGVVPSTIDEIPAAEVYMSEPPKLFTHLGFFGAQSERGFSVRSAMQEMSEDGQELRWKIRRRAFCTKIDVPFAQLQYFDDPVREDLLLARRQSPDAASDLRKLGMNGHADEAPAKSRLKVRQVESYAPARDTAIHGKKSPKQNNVSMKSIMQSTSTNAGQR